MHETTATRLSDCPHHVQDFWVIVHNTFGYNSFTQNQIHELCYTDCDNDLNQSSSNSSNDNSRNKSTNKKIRPTKFRVAHLVQELLDHRMCKPCGESNGALCTRCEVSIVVIS